MADQAQTDHQHGSMDIRQHQRTFAGFLRLTTIAVVVIFAILVFLALSNA